MLALHSLTSGLFLYSTSKYAILPLDEERQGSLPVNNEALDEYKVCLEFEWARLMIQFLNPNLPSQSQMMLLALPIIAIYITKSHLTYLSLKPALSKRDR